MTFLPTGYKLPEKKSRYYKFQNGDNKFRILSKAIVGYEEWTQDNKPVRHENYPQTILNPERPPKHFWAFIIWDYRANETKILEITQATIQSSIYNLEMDENWGNPTNYDLNVKKVGEKLETEYNVVPTPPKALSKEIKEAYKNCNINLQEIFKGGDPFNSSEKAEDINVSDIPF